MKQEPRNSGANLPILLSIGPVGGLSVGAVNLLLGNVRSQGLLLPTLLRPAARWSVLKQSAVDIVVQCGRGGREEQTGTSCDLYSFFSPRFEWLFADILQIAAFAYSWGLAFALLLLSVAGLVEAMRRLRRQWT